MLFAVFLVYLFCYFCKDLNEEEKYTMKLPSHEIVGRRNVTNEYSQTVSVYTGAHTHANNHMLTHTLKWSEHMNTESHWKLLIIYMARLYAYFHV